jgi:hypothetical protein
MTQKKVLITGQSGVGVTLALERFCSREPRLAGLLPEDKPFLKLEDQLQNLYLQDNPEDGNLDPLLVWQHRILTLPYDTIRTYWAKAMRWINRQARSASHPYIFNLHACYYHHNTNEYLPFFNLNQLRAFSPDTLITLGSA